MTMTSLWLLRMKRRIINFSGGYIDFKLTLLANCCNTDGRFPVCGVREISHTPVITQLGAFAAQAAGGAKEEKAPDTPFQIRLVAYNKQNCTCILKIKPPSFDFVSKML